MTGVKTNWRNDLTANFYPHCFFQIKTKLKQSICQCILNNRGRELMILMIVSSQPSAGS